VAAEKKFNPRLREGDRVRLDEDVEGEKRTYRAGELATILELPTRSKELIESWISMDMYDVMCDEGGVVTLLGKSMERVPGRSTVQYGRDNEVSISLPNLESMGHGAPPLKEGDRVELATDVTIDGTGHAEGTAGFILLDELGDDIGANLQADYRWAVVLDKGGFIAVPRFLLVPSSKAGPTRL
jgi:hypothetical protein